MACAGDSLVLNNGRKIPRVGLGTFDARDSVMREALRTALQAGYRHIDAAFLHKSEAAVGEELQEWFGSGRIKREDVFVTSKLPGRANRPEDVETFLNGTLEGLRLSYLDLYLLHGPFIFISEEEDDEESTAVSKETLPSNDMNTDLEAVWKAMERQVEKGKVRSIGVSNFNDDQIERIMRVAQVRPVVSQVEANAFNRQRRLQAVCRKHGIALCAYGPLGSPYRPHGAGHQLLAHPSVVQIAKRLQKMPSQVVLRHLIQHDMIVLPKSANSEQIKDHLQVFDFVLTPLEMEALDSLDRGSENHTSQVDISVRSEMNAEYPFNIPP